MINSMQVAIIRKDLGRAVSDKHVFLSLWLIPLIFSVVFPLIFVFAIYFSPEDLGDFQMMLDLLPFELAAQDIGPTVLGLLLNNMMPMFFMIVPITTTTVMAASSFVGEKEKRTLETLLYSPLSIKQIYQAKVWSAFTLSMIISFGSFIIMQMVVQTVVFLLMGSLLPLGIGWLITLLVVAPAVTLLSITLIVSGSAKARTMEDSQARSIFLILPVILFVVGQFAGVILINAWLLLGLGVALLMPAVLLMNYSMKKFTYEILLR